MSKNETRDNSVLNSFFSSAKEKLFSVENDDSLTDDEKVSKMIKITSAVCAGIAIQPIPFADFFILTPIQAFMGTRIASIRGVPVSESEAKDIIVEIASVVGLGLLAQQCVIGLYKTFIPFLGAITSIPLVFGLTYAIGRVMDYYFQKKFRGDRIDEQVLKDLWNEALKKGKKEGKDCRNDIVTQSKTMVVRND